MDSGFIVIYLLCCMLIFAGLSLFLVSCMDKREKRYKAEIQELERQNQVLRQAVDAQEKQDKEMLKAFRDLTAAASAMRAEPRCGYCIESR